MFNQIRRKIFYCIDICHNCHSEKKKTSEFLGINHRPHKHPINKQTIILLKIKTWNKWRTPPTVPWRHVSKIWNINSKMERFTKKTTSCTVEFHAESNYNKIDPQKWKLWPPSVLQAFGPIRSRAGNPWDCNKGFWALAYRIKCCKSLPDLL